MTEPLCEEAESSHETHAKATVLPPLNLRHTIHAARRTNDSRDKDRKAATTLVRKAFWEDSLRRLHLVQHEERHNVMKLAVTTVREKRAEWVGAPVHPELSLDGLLGDGCAGAQTLQARPHTTRANQRAMDALITPRGASIPRLEQAARSPRRWMSKIQAGYLTAREKRLLHTEHSAEDGPGGTFITACESSNELASGSSENLPIAEAQAKAETRKKKKAAAASLAALLPNAARELSLANSEILKHSSQLRTLNDKCPSLDRSVYLADCREKLREARATILKVQRRNASASAESLVMLSMPLVSPARTHARACIMSMTETQELNEADVASTINC